MCSIHSLLVQYPRHVILTTVCPWYQTGHNRQWLFEFDGIKYCKQFFSETTIYVVGPLAACAFCSPFYFYSIQWWVWFKFNIILWLRSISLPSARPTLHKCLIPLCNNEEPEVGCRMVGYKIVLLSHATIAYCSFNSRHKMRRTLIFFVFIVFFILLLRKFNAVPLRCGVTSRFTIFYNSTQVWDGVVLAGSPMMWTST